VHAGAAEPATVAPFVQHSFVAQLSAPAPAPLSEPNQTPTPIPAILDGARYVGILFNTYILYDHGEELVMVDQHAAHERIRYEKLRRRALSDGKPHSQALLIPEAVRFEDTRRTELEARLSWLERIGFEVEIFGEGTLLFRGVPAEWGTDSLKMRLKNLTERLLETELPEQTTANPFFFDEEIFERLASEACHSAIRAGDRILEPEAEQLTRDLFLCEHPWNCPHGRPTVVRVPRGKLEEWFQRRANV